MVKRVVIALVLCLLSRPAWAQDGIALLEAFQKTVVTLADRVKPMVVHISPAKMGALSGKNGEAPIPPQGEKPEIAPGTGSGVIIDKSGVIVTNSHVIGTAKMVTVQLLDKTKYEGKVIGRDPDTDLAVIKIDAGKALPFVTVGDSSKVRVGQWVMAVGNPLGLDGTVTVGIVSALGREGLNLSRYEDFIQTDAAINPGNSGGPLFNIHGELVGINTAIINLAQGIGFAIPSNMMTQIVSQLSETGKVVRGWLGVGIQALTAELAGHFQVKERSGVLVNEVFSGDPASKAGIRPGDIILKINGQAVDGPGALARLVASLSPDKKASVDILQGGVKKTLQIALAKRKDDDDAEEGFEVLLGMGVQDVTPELAQKFKIKGEKGVVVSKVEQGGVAQVGGLKEGDLILEINRKTIENISDFSEAVDALEEKKSSDILVRAVREEHAFFTALHVERPKETP